MFMSLFFVVKCDEKSSGMRVETPARRRWALGQRTLQMRSLGPRAPIRHVKTTI